MNVYIRLFLMYISLNSVFLRASEQNELNYSFIQGDYTEVPLALQTLGFNVPGDHLVDVRFNDVSYGRRVLKISEQETESICLKADWLNGLDLPINYHKVIGAYIPKRECYDFTKIEGGAVKFSFSTQTLTMSLPQVTILNITPEEKWDFGSNALRLTYDLNANETISNDSAGYNSFDSYGGFNTLVNVDRWVLNARASVTKGAGFNTPSANISTPIQSIKGDLSMGRNVISAPIVQGFSYDGVQIRSNRSMLDPNLRGYSPVVDGIASGKSRVTIKQDEYTIISRIVPAGPYSFSDVSAIYSGELTIIEEELDTGEKTTRTMYVSTLPNLLRKGNLDYSLSVGSKTDETRMFIAGGLDYGLSFGTVNLASIISRDYQSLGYGVGVPLNKFGALTASINYSWSRYSKPISTGFIDNTLDGHALEIQYSKVLGRDTNLQIIGYQYASKGYVEFSDFKPDNLLDAYSRRSRSDRLTFNVTHRMGLNRFSVNGWYDRYRDSSNRQGISFTASRSFKALSVNIASTYQSGTNSRDVLSSSINFSFPFSAFGRDHYSFSNMHYNNNDDSFTVNTGASLRYSDKVSGGLNVSYKNNRKTNTSLYGNVNFDNVSTSVGLSRSDAYTNISGSVRGSVLATPKTKVIFSNKTARTIAIARVQGLDGVEFNDNYAADGSGVAVIPLSPYRKNSITLNGDAIPANIELLTSSFENVVPVNGAVLVKDFNYIDVQRYFVKVSKRNGEYPSFGSLATTMTGEILGYIAEGGLLVITSLEPIDKVEIRGKDKSCYLDLSEVPVNKDYIFDVICSFEGS
ncbi:fimbria/pilus outer membrane usher protein [Vibrio nomapromontoriensis]|uniref:fimbria/pilus outer membrane usher protein n=1 Tax=Vibrio nomapromontoriensis TaxID=2910246 RepID=UPI003D102160